LIAWSTEASNPIKKFTSVQRLAMRPTLGVHRTTSTAAMEVESATQPAWIRLQTKVLSAAVRLQSLARNHPIKRWTRKANKAASTGRHIKHMSNLENIAVEFPFALQRVQQIWPFERAPWDPGPKQQACAEPSEAPTKEIVRAEIRKLAKTKWEEQWEKGGKGRPNCITAPHLRRIMNNSEITQGPNLYKAIKHRWQSCIIAQLRTGHCGLNDYLARFKRADDASCPNCGHRRETVGHYLLECKHYQGEREALIKEVGITRMRLAYLLGDKDGVCATLKFIKATGRLVEGKNGI
jgi:hypothetical protein